MNNFLVDMDSFGALCPENWEEIADFLNNLTLASLAEDPDTYYTDDPGDPLTDEGRELVNKIWERYCNGDIPGAPEAIF